MKEKELQLIDKYKKQIEKINEINTLIIDVTNFIGNELEEYEEAKNFATKINLMQINLMKSTSTLKELVFDVYEVKTNKNGK